MRKSGPSVLPGACDCHLHVIGPKHKYPLAPKRVYTPMDAPLSDLLKMHENLGIERLVLVQTSIFEYDNSCMFDALRTLGSRARGVAVLESNTSEESLDEMHKIGVRGLRINLATFGHSSIDKIKDEIKKVASLCVRNNWHIQVFTSADVISAIAPTIQTIPIPVVADHFALLPPQAEVSENERIIRNLLEEGNLWVKISAPYRIDGKKDNDFFNPEICNLARRLYLYNPNRIIWGTDWPHTPVHNNRIEENEEAPYRDINTKELLEELYRWFNGIEDLEQILVNNPSNLYGFN